MFLLICEDSMRYDDGYGHAGSPSYSTLNYSTVKEFTDEEKLKEWIIRNSESYSPVKFKVYRATELNVSTKVVVSDFEEVTNVRGSL